MFKLHRNISQAWMLDAYQSFLNTGIREFYLLMLIVKKEKKVSQGHVSQMA